MRAVALLGLCLAGCGGGASSLARARQSDTVEAYRNVLRARVQQSPADGDEDEAGARLAELEFERAKRLHTVVAYKRFLEAYPEGSAARTVEALLEGLRFNAAKEAGTPEALRGFLREHPRGAHQEEARRLRAEAERVDVAGSGDLARIESYLRDAPAGEDRDRAQAHLDDERFARASGATAWLAYLRDSPAGAHRTQAQAALFRTEVEGLLVSGLIEEAEARVATHPLGAGWTGFAGLATQARAEREAARTPDLLAQQSLPSHYLRSLEDLGQALGAPDPLDRWEAAEELGQHVTIKVLEPLLMALRSGRNALLRQRALKSLWSVLSALPPRVAEYEVAIRLESLRARASSPEVYLPVAVLLDWMGQLEAAAAEYQRAFEGALPDPLILRRWVDIRRERRQAFSAAVAARQLALWASEVAGEDTVTAEGGIPLASARALCAAVESARYAHAAILWARGEQTEFPNDLAVFAREARDALKLSEARLADAELLLRTQVPTARPCSERAVAERVQSAVIARRAALRKLPAHLPRRAAALLALARDRDPSMEVRTQAAALLADLAPP